METKKEIKTKEEIQPCKHTKYKYKARTPQGIVLDRYCKCCDKLLKKDANPDTFENFVRKFIHGKLDEKRVCGYYKVSKDHNKLVYEGTGRKIGYGQDILALKLRDGRIIGNASTLHRCGSYSKGDEAPAQRVMFDLNIAIIPFNVFEEAKLNIQTAKIIEQGKEEDFTLPKLEWNTEQAQLTPVEFKFSEFFRKEPKTDNKKIVLGKHKESQHKYLYDKKGNVKRNKKGHQIERKIEGWRTIYIDKTKLAKRHFVGAMLIEVKEKQFLFDIDRRELKHYRFNPFLSELPKKTNTIKQAYEILKPKEVKEAEKKGIKVKRQGEWFFIPSKLPEPSKELKEIKKQLDNPPLLDQYDIQSGDYGHHVYAGQIIRITPIKKSKRFRELIPEYGKQLLKRIRDYNKKAEKHRPLKKQIKKLEKNTKNSNTAENYKQDKTDQTQ